MKYSNKGEVAYSVKNINQIFLLTFVKSWIFNFNIYEGRMNRTRRYQSIFFFFLKDFEIHKALNWICMWIRNFLIEKDYCFLNHWLSKVLPWFRVKIQCSNFTILSAWMWSKLKKVVWKECMCGICLCVFFCICMYVVNFSSRDNSKEVTQIALNFFHVLLTFLTF